MWRGLWGVGVHTHTADEVCLASIWYSSFSIRWVNCSVHLRFFIRFAAACICIARVGSPGTRVVAPSVAGQVDFDLTAAAGWPK